MQTNRFFALVATAACCGLHTSATAQSPNDLCINAIALTAETPTNGAIIAADTNDSPTSTSTNNGCSAGFIGTTRKSVYYTFVPAASGLWEVSLCASSNVLDSRLAIWAATNTTPGAVAPCAGTVAPLACNDDACSARPNFNVRLTAGTGYIIQLSPFMATATGPFIILVHGPQSTSAPANDNCASSVPLTSGSPVSGDLTNATGTSTTLATCGETATTGNDIWYSATAPVVGIGTVSVCGNFDTVVSVYTDTSTCGSLTSLACNDDTVASGCLTHGSSTSWNAAAGSTHLIRVAGVQPPGTVSPAGSFGPAHGAVTVNYVLTPTGSCCPSAFAGGCTVTSQAGCVGVWTAAGVCSPDPCPSGSCCIGQCCAVGGQIGCNGVAGTWTSGGTCAAGSCTAPVANDVCSAAIPISVGSTVVGGNCGATVSAGEPVPTCQAFTNASVWYKVTPATTGYYDLNLCGATFDCVITVLTTNCSMFLPVACDDDSCTGGETGPIGNSGHANASLLTAGLNGGATYHLRVAGFSANTGIFPLRVSANSVAGACCNLASGTCTFAANSAACTGSFQRGVLCSPFPCPVSGACCHSDGTCTLELGPNCMAPNLHQGGGTVCNPGCPTATVGSCCDSLCGNCIYVNSSSGCLGVYAARGVCSPSPCVSTVANDTCPTATTVAVGSPAATGTNICASSTGESVNCTNMIKGVWFNFTSGPAGTYIFDTETSPQADTVLAVYSACGGTQLACDDDSGTFTLARISLALAAGQNVKIMLGTFANATAGGYVLNITAPVTGACCCGSNCSLTAAAACTGANKAFSGPGTACTPFSFTVPCCRGDFNKTGVPASVQDIFDFLAVYFSIDPCADTNDSGATSVQDIFDFLAAYFAGCP